MRDRAEVKPKLSALVFVVVVVIKSILVASYFLTLSYHKINLKGINNVGKEYILVDKSDALSIKLFVDGV